MTSNAAPTAVNKINWGDKLIPLILFIAIALLLFRPLLLNDYRQLMGGDTSAKATQPAVTTATATTASPTTAAEKTDTTATATAPTTATAQAATTTPPAAQAGPAIPREQIVLNTWADLICVALVIGAIIFVITGRIGSIAAITFKEAVRNRILYLILFFALILMGSSGIIKELAIGAHDTIIRDLGLACISLFGLLVAIAVGISLVYNELDRRTIYTIVSKPLHRWQFLLGKFFGLLLTIYVIVAIMTLFFFIVVNYQSLTTDEMIEKAIMKSTANGTIEVAHPLWEQTKFLSTAAVKSVGISCGNLFGFAYGAVSQNLMIVIAMTCLELMIVTAFVVFYSSFTTPTLSVIFTVMTFLAGRLNEDIMRFAAKVVKNGMDAGTVIVDATNHIQINSVSVQIKVILAKIAAIIVPNLDSLNLTSEAINQTVVHVWRFPVLYAICYTATVLMVAILIFRKRNFK